MVQVNAASEDEVIQWVTFCIGEETYGIAVMQVREVIRVSDITPVPGADEHILGIINLRGNVVTVLDMHRQLALPPSDLTDQSRIIISESDEQVIGLLVDSVAEVVYLKASEVEVRPNVGNEEGAKFIRGVHSEGEQLLILVDVDQMLIEEEQSEEHVA